MFRRAALFLAFFLAAGIAGAAEFRTGQAARAVIGQSSFTARNTGIQGQSLSFSNGKLYVADISGRVLTFEHLFAPIDNGTERSAALCAVCGFSASATSYQPVSSMAAQYSSFGNAVAVVDIPNRRVLVWRNAHSPQAAKGPDLVLEADREGSPIDNSTLLEPVSVALDGKRLFVGDRALRRILVWNNMPVDSETGADAVLGQTSFATIDSATAGAAHFADPQALVSDGTNLFVSDKGNHRVLVFAPGDLPLTADAVVNSASLKPGPLAPGTLISINGRQLSEAEESAEDDGEHSLPTELAGVQVMLDGRPLPLISVSPSQIRAQLPYTLSGTESSLLVRRGAANETTITTNAAAISITPVSPGIFAFGGSEPRSGVLLHDKGLTTVSGSPVTTDDPVRPGEAVTVWATGLGAVNSADPNETAEAGQPYAAADSETQMPVEAYLNGQPLPVLHAGLAQNAVGIYEVQILMPTSFPSGPLASLTISQGGISSNSVTFPAGSAIH